MFKASSTGVAEWWMTILFHFPDFALTALSAFTVDELSKLGIKVKSMRNESNRLEELFIEMIKK